MQLKLQASRSLLKDDTDGAKNSWVYSPRWKSKWLPDDESDDNGDMMNWDVWNEVTVKNTEFQEARIQSPSLSSVWLYTVWVRFKFAVYAICRRLRRSSWRTRIVMLSSFSCLRPILYTISYLTSPATPFLCLPLVHVFFVIRVNIVVNITIFCIL